MLIGLSNKTDAWEVVLTICRMVSANGGRTYCVGGSVRDALLRIPVKEYDLEVYGIAPQALITLLKESFRIDLVGKSFGVIKLRDYPIDVSLPRRERKSGIGHRDFIIASDHTMTPEEACMRRDFTVNAMMYDPMNDTLTDPLGGQKDLVNKILRHCSAQFTEDPLRALRGMRFSAVFELTPAPETLALMETIDIEPLTKTRIFDEWKKMLLKADKPSMGLEFLRQSRLDRFYPELVRLQGCPQDPVYHPEGDVWNHTKCCLDAFAMFRPADNHNAVIAGLAVLCHDLGKPDTTLFKTGNRIGSARHDLVGEKRAKTFLARITDAESIPKFVLPLVRYHMVPYNLYVNDNPFGSVRRLAHKAGNIKLMAVVVAADHNGRGDDPLEHVPEARYLIKMATELELLEKRPVPLILGRHLIEFGMTPGKQFGPILTECFDAQLNGSFTTEIDARIYLKTALTKKGLLSETR